MGTTTVLGAGAAMSRPCNFSSCSRFTIRNNGTHHQIAKLDFNLGESSSSLTSFRKFSKLEFGEIAKLGIHARPQFRKIGRMMRCKAAEQSTSTSSSTGVYQGVYGPWTIDPSDIREVMLYRSGLVTAALSFVLASSTAFLPGNSLLNETLEKNLDLLYVLGSAGLGLSLYLIHIYVTEIKRTLQAFWALGVVGSLVTYTSLAQPAGEGLVQYVVDNPTVLWFVGPLFAALTGLVFKEGLCYGKLEAAVLTFIIPATLLGHLTGLMDDGVKLSLLGVWMVLFTIFAGRKFTQPVKDDIGDKSVFIFNALPEEEKEALLEKLGQQRL